jgi:hypothetical protein
VQSVVPIILLSATLFGVDGRDRLRKQILYYAKMLKNKWDIEYFVYFISHCNPGFGMSDIEARVRDVIDKSTEDEKSDDRFMHILNDLETQTKERKIFIINPLDNNPKPILIELLKRK